MNDVQIAAVQTICALLAGAFLFALWRTFARQGVAVKIVALGLAGRALLSAGLFWISWMRLPVARSLQLRDGHWFFGLDGIGYYSYVDRLLERGVAAGALTTLKSDPAYLYVQLLALLRVLLGFPISAAVLLNLASFIGAAILVAKWGRRIERPEAAAVVLVCLSVSPSFVLWSTQPLKDTFFCFLIVLFAYVVGIWMEALESRSLGLLIVSSVGLLVVSQILGGVRWQSVPVLWIAFVPAALVQAVMTAKRSVNQRTAILALVIVSVAMGVATSTLEPLESWVVEKASSPRWMLDYLKVARLGFMNAYQPSTIITVGPLIEDLPQADFLARGLMTFLPRFATYPLGLASAHGGRGLWWFAELDTMVLGGFTIWIGRRYWSGNSLYPRTNPMVLFLVIFLLCGLSMLYVVDNFGTLMRFRLMLVLPVFLLPLAVQDVDREKGSGHGASLGRSSGSS